MSLSRRQLLAHLAATGALALGTPRLNAADAATHASDARRHDWDWLRGYWSVRHRRLRERLVGDTRWEEFGGCSSFWRTLDGLGNVDDNLVELPSGTYRGVSLRAFDPASATWAIWWLDARAPHRLDPPVRGAFDGDSGTFVGRDTLRDRPIVMRFRWRDVHGARPWWEQAFSPDDGASWEVNWRNWFTRIDAQPRVLPRLAQAPTDFDFLVGEWRVTHRRLRQRLVGSREWDTFDGGFRNWPLLGGFGNMGDNLMRFPSRTVRGMGWRSFDPATNQWASWWLDSRTPDRIGAPLLGGFADGIGTFLGEEQVDGRTLRTRVIWSRISSRSARWEQASSADGGASWETNWISDFERRA
jgi:hypothetical protein